MGPAKNEHNLLGNFSHRGNSRFQKFGLLSSELQTLENEKQNPSLLFKNMISQRICFQFDYLLLFYHCRTRGRNVMYKQGSLS